MSCVKFDVHGNLIGPDGKPISIVQQKVKRFTKAAPLSLPGRLSLHDVTESFKDVEAKLDQIEMRIHKLQKWLEEANVLVVHEKNADT